MEPGHFLQLWQLLGAEAEGRRMELGLLLVPEAIRETHFLLWAFKVILRGEKVSNFLFYLNNFMNYRIRQRWKWKIPQTPNSLVSWVRKLRPSEGKELLGCRASLL